MARISPPVFPPLQGKALKDEKRTFNKFRFSDGDFHVIHSLDLPNPQNRQETGEADFVVLAPNKGIFIIEVKGGGLQFKDGQWYSVRGPNKRRINSPHAQAKDNAYAVRDKLKEKFPGKKGFGDTLITWGCVFPSQAYNAVGSEFEEKWRVWDANSFYHDIKEFIELLHIKQIKKFKSKNRRIVLPSEEQIEKYSKFLRRDFEIPKLLKSHGDAIDKKIHRYTEDQLETLDELEGNDRILIRGGAGTGKTLIAAEVIRRQLQKNKKPLFLCYNKEITSKVQSMMLEEGYYHLYPKYPTIKTFHEYLSNSLLFDKSVLDEFQKNIKSNEWFNGKMQQVFIDRIKEFDKIISETSNIIDEKHIIKYKIMDNDGDSNGARFVDDVISFGKANINDKTDFDDEFGDFLSTIYYARGDKKEIDIFKLFDDFVIKYKNKPPDKKRFDCIFEKSKIVVIDKLKKEIDIIVISENISKLREIHLNFLDNFKNDYVDILFNDKHSIQASGVLLFTKDNKRIVLENLNTDVFTLKSSNQDIKQSIVFDFGINTPYKRFFEMNVDFSFYERKIYNPFSLNLEKDHIIERIDNEHDYYSSKKQEDYFQYISISDYYKSISPMQQFDVVIIDESQDIIGNRNNLNCIHLSTKNGIQNGEWNFFLDPMQFSSSFHGGIQDGIQTYKRIKENLEEVVNPRYHTLITNCRNTKEIAETMFKICDIESGSEELGMKYKVNEDIESGLRPNFVYYKENEEIPKILNEILKPLKKEKISGKDIQILSLDKDLDKYILDSTQYFNIFSVDSYGNYRNPAGNSFGQKSSAQGILHFWESGAYLSSFSYLNRNPGNDDNFDEETFLKYDWDKEDLALINYSYIDSIFNDFVFSKFLDKDQSKQLVEKLKHLKTEDFNLPDNLDLKNFRDHPFNNVFNIKKPKWISFHDKFFKIENNKRVVDIDEIRMMATLENWYKEFSNEKRVFLFDLKTGHTESDYNPSGNETKVYSGEKIKKGFTLDAKKRNELNARGKAGKLSKAELEYYNNDPNGFTSTNEGDYPGKNIENFIEEFAKACNKYKHFEDSSAKHSSVYKFRGMDQKYITLVGLHNLKPRDLQSLYIGMSRAKVKLEVIAHQSLEQPIAELLDG